MVGNKHKNGIICTYPDCNRSMRTQKFKAHFSKKHLKEGEVYSIEHRRQYEVARHENARTLEKLEKLEFVPTINATAAVEEVARLGAANTAVVSSAVVAAAQEAFQAQAKGLALLQSQQAQLVSQYVTSEPETEENSSSNTVSAYAPTALASAPAKQSSGNKRPSSAMETSEVPADPTNALLMQFIALMDQRFQELVGKMSEMIDVQKDLIDTLQASNPNGQAPASAFSSAVEVVMKRRKKEMTPHGDSGDTIEIAEENGETQESANNCYAL